MGVYYDIVMDLWQKGDIPEFRKQFIKFLDQGVFSLEEKKRLADLYLKSLETNVADLVSLSKRIDMTSAAGKMVSRMWTVLGKVLMASMEPEEQQRFLDDLQKHTKSQEPGAPEDKSDKN